METATISVHQIELNIQTLEDLILDNAADAARFEGTSMGDWYDGRAKAYKIAKKMFEALLLK